MKKATDGIVQHRRLTNPVTLHPNYYAQLEEVVDTRSTKMRLRPELLQFGKLNLEPKIYGKEFQSRIVYLLSQNATTLDEKNTTKTIETKSTQTPDAVDTITDQSISFLSETRTGISAPAVLDGTDSDSSVKIHNQCFQPGEQGESNSESAERHREIQRNIQKEKEETRQTSSETQPTPPKVARTTTTRGDQR
jgi:hypothetical protein